MLVVNIILLVLIVVLVLVLSMVWPPDSPWAPWWRTKDPEIREGLKLTNVTKNDTVYDLGCGDGRVLIIAAKEFEAKGVGIEIDPLRALLARLLVRYCGVADKVRIIRGNFFDQDLSNATVVFVYLVPKALTRLKPKLLKELKKGTRIVSFRYKIDLPLALEDKAHNLSLYKI